MTVSFNATGPGRGAKSPVFARGFRVGMAMGKLTPDTSYPTGGWDVSDIFSEFAAESSNSNIYVFVESPGGYVLVVDHANKKVLAYRQTAATGALAEVPNGTNISVALGTPRFLAFGVLA